MSRYITRRRMPRRVVDALMALLLSLGSLHAAEFDYLDNRANLVSTTHLAEYRLRIDAALRLLGELHQRQARGCVS